MFKQRNKPEMIADLDAMLVEPVSFRFRGRVHEIAPVTVEQFMRFTNSFMKFSNMQSETLTPEQVIEGYWNVVREIAPSIQKEDVEQATQTQLASLFSLIVKTVTGETFAEKKKTMKETEQTTQH